MFRPTVEELFAISNSSQFQSKSQQDQAFTNLRSQSATSSLPKSEHGGRRYKPYAFTEQGVAMLSSVLNSERAVKVNIEIMRTFVRIKRMISSNAELSKKLDELENKYDGQFKIVFEAIRALMKQEDPKQKKQIGF